MNILMASANFADSYIDTEREQRSLQRLVNSSSSGCLRVLPAAEVADLRETLATDTARNHLDIFHFTGHACRDHGLHLRAPGRGKDYLGGNELKQLLQHANIKLVVLNACNSDSLAVTLSEAVGVAIGTTRNIRDVVARQFTVNFYQALMQGETIADAFELAMAEQKPAASPAYVAASLQSNGNTLHHSL